MNTACPDCRHPIPLEDINVGTDLALCRRCQKTFSFARLQEDAAIQSIPLATPPRGTWFHEEMGLARAGSTARSWAALFFIPFTLIWSGGSLGGIFGSQIVSGKFEPWSLLFGLPFVIGTCVLVPVCAMSLAGRYEVRVSDGQVAVFTGVGPLGWRRRFALADLRSVRLTEGTTQKTGTRPQRITFDLGSRTVHFASGLKNDRQLFLLAAIRRMTRR